mgnify:FL=1
MFTFSALLSLLTLTLLEIVLGIDNVIFVSIIMGRMPKAQQKKARYYWMFGGIIIRTALLASLTWLIQHGNKVLFTLPLLDKGFTLRGLIMLGGGLFLLVKTVGEIHQKLEGEEHGGATSKAKPNAFAYMILQIL